MAIIPSNTQFVGDTTGVPIQELRSAQINAMSAPFTMQDIIDTVGGGGGGPLDPNDDVYSNQLYTNNATVAANITSYSEATVPDTISGLMIFGGMGSVSMYGMGLPIFTIGSQIICYDGMMNPFLIEVIEVYTSNSGTFEGNYTLISGDDSQGFDSYITVDITNTLIDIDTDLTGVISAGNSVILGGLVYETATVTSSSISFGSAIANIEFIDTVGLANDFEMLSTKATLTNGVNAGKTPVLAYNAVTDRVILSGGISFFGEYTNSVFIGNNSGNVSAPMFTGNTAIGSQTLKNITTNSGSNTAIGDGALRDLTEAYGNTAVGSESMNFNITGGDNTSIGRSSLLSNTSGYENTVVGSGALFSNTSGSQNTAIGTYTSSGNFSGSVILGEYAGSTADNQFVVGSSSVNAGAVVTQTNTSSQYWEVVINGVTRKVLLA